MTKEELIKRLEESAVAIYEDEGSYDYMFKAIADEVKTSDLVEVIRCKDCRYRGNGYKKGFGHDLCICTKLYQLMYDDDFCSHAERKEDKK